MHCSSSLLVSSEDAFYLDLGTDFVNLLGTDTTAHTLTMGTWYLLNNIDMVKTLRKELVDVIPDLDSAVTVSWVTLEKLPYLVSCILGSADSENGNFRILIPFSQRAVVKESLRFSFGVPGRLQRIVPATGAVFCSLQIPPGVCYLSLSRYFPGAKLILE
jgi:cytochrome P450